MRRALALTGALGVLASAIPAAAQTCFVYSDSQQAKVPIQCVQKGTLSPPCSWPTDCTVIPASGSQTILQMHEVWHQCFGPVGGATPPAGRSHRWYAFHRQFEHDFNQWRRTINYPPIESLEWCPGMNMPHGTGPAVSNHPSGCGTGTPRPDARACPNCIAFAQCLFLPGAGPASCPNAPSPNCQTPDGSV